MKLKTRNRQSHSSEDSAIVERMFRRLMSAVDKRQSKALGRLSRSLSKTFDHVCPTTNPELRGRIIALLVDVVRYSDGIKKDVQKLTRLKRPTDARALRSFLTDMQLLRLQHQQRYIAELRRNIPILLRSVKKGNGTQSKRRGLIDELTDMVKFDD